MEKLNFWDWSAIVVLIIGGLNWGLFGLFGFDLIRFIFGEMTLVSRVIYVLVGLAAVYEIFASFGLMKMPSGHERMQTSH